MSTRVTAATGFVTEAKVSVTAAARVLGVSRQEVYDRKASATATPAEPRPALRLVAPLLPDDWQSMDLRPQRCDVETAIVKRVADVLQNAGIAREP